MSNDKHNGWTNYETWNVALWMDNNEGDQNYWVERAEEVFRASQAGESYSSQTRAEAAAHTLSDEIKEQHMEACPTDLPGPGCFADLLSAALSCVNWYEIAEHYIADLDTVAIEKGEREEVEA